MKKLRFLSFTLTILILTITSCKKVKIPEISTKTATEVTNYSALSGGIITDNKVGVIIEKGVCWSKKSNPTINDSRSVEQGGNLDFSTNLTKLEPLTTYYYRAYATNEAGTGYGEEFTIKTSAILEFTFNSVVYQIYPVDNLILTDWGAFNIETGAISDFSGLQNTDLITSASTNSAAKICKELTYMSKTDWHLPARSELNKIFEMKSQFANGNLGSNYWSSTELNANQAFSQSFVSGEISASSKSEKHNIRCIRKKN